MATIDELDAFDPEDQLAEAINTAASNVVSAIGTHAGSSDPHPGYQKESEKDVANGYAGLDANTRLPTARLGSGTANNTVFLRGDQTWATPPSGGGGTHDSLTGVTADQHHAQTHGLSGSDHTASGLTAGHVLRASGAAAFSFAALQDADIPATIARDSEVTSAVSTHEGAADPHGGYQKESEKAAANGYAGLDSNTRVPTAQLGSGAASAATFLRGDQTWAAPVGGGGVTAGVVRKTGNQTMTATSQTAVTDMSFPVDALSTYYFRMDVVISTSSGSSPTTAWGFTGPAAPVAVSVVAEIDTSTSVESSPVPLAAFGNFASGAQVANTGAKFQGTVQTGAASGTVQLTCARGGTNPSMVVTAGCNGMWIKVS